MRKPALLIATFALVTVQSQMASADPREGPYFTLEGGVNFLQDNDITVNIPNQQPISGELFYNSGWAAGAAAGYQWSNGLALEAEMAYRQNGIDGEEVMGTPMAIDGIEGSLAFMANAKFNLDTGTRLTPFIGAGMGLAVIKVDAQPDGGGDFIASDTQFAYQGIAGVSYEILPHLSLALQYIYFATKSPTFEDSSVSVDMDYHSQDLLMSLRYDLH